MYIRHQRGANGNSGEGGAGMQVILRRDAKKLGLKRYYTGVPCAAAGHLCERQTSTGHCLKCNLIRVKANYDPIEKAIYRKKHYAKTADEQRERCRQWHAANRENRSSQRKLRRQQQSEIVRYLDRQRYQKAWDSDPLFRLGKIIRARTLSAIKRNYKRGIIIRDLGCTVDQVKAHISSKFSLGMSWNNWGTFWEIDHIKTLSSFDLTDPVQFRAACHYTNLQPLTIAKHREKTTKDRRK